MTKWSPSEMPDQHGKLAVVTGANSGLGYHTARALALRGAHVVLACRSRDKTEAAITALAAEVPGASLEYLALDLADLDSIAGFAAAVATKFPRLDLLINNAGVMALPLARTRQGFEMQIGTNHLGHFALTGQLLPLMPPGARVVTVASLAHTWAQSLDLDDLNWERKRYRPWRAYGHTKLANLLFAYELDRRLARSGAGVISVAAHPGYAATNLQLVGPEITGSALGRGVMRLGNWLLAQPADMGALPQLFAATMPVAGGDYYGPDGLRGNRGYPTKARSNRASRDEPAARALWTLSEQLTGVRYLGA